MLPASANTPAIFYGGATVIVDPEGSVRYVICKNVRNESRLDDYRRYLGESGRTFWAAKADGAWLLPEVLPR